MSVACADSLGIQAYFDGELDAAAVAALETHLRSCAQCRALLEDLQAARARLRQLPAMTASPALRANIERALDAQDARDAPRARPGGAWRARTFWLGAFSGLGAAALAVAAVLFIILPLPGAVLDGVVAAHVRSLMSGHVMDVVSTDRHTVKPWFAGHADVSPAVADFAGQGYRLLGGRADYLDHQRAAVLVYEHGAHLINVFSWAAERHALPARATRDGYHVMSWRSGDLQYCAVSDAGWDELGRLAGLLQALASADSRE
jgi:anti-sigma factor RsiW